MDRIIVSDISIGGTGSSTITEIGATVVHAQKGFEQPIFFGAENTEQLKQYFGTPSVKYPNVSEAFDFNTFGNMYISAPNKDGRYGAIGIPKTGAVIEFPMGVTSSEIETEDYTKPMYNYKSTEVIDSGEGTYTTPTTDVVAESCFIYLKDGTKLQMTVVEDATTETYSLVNASDFPEFVSAVYTLASGEFVITLSTAKDFKKIGEVGVRLDKSALFTADGTLMVLTSTPTDIPVKVTTSVTAAGLLGVTVYETIAGSTVDRGGYVFSLNPDSKDDFGVANYVDDVIVEVNPFIKVVPVDVDYNTFTLQELDLQELQGSTRGAVLPASAPAGGSYAKGFGYFADRSRYPVDIFFDASNEDSTPAVIDSLLQGAQKDMSGIYAIKQDTAENILAEPSVAKKGITNPDMACYDSWHIMTNTYGSGAILRNLTGRIAIKYAQMSDVANGLSPSFTDEGGHGGQLGGGVVKALYADRNDVKLLLDDNHINFVGNDVTYGLMIQGDRTCSSTNGDYSYIGHRRLRNLIAHHLTTVVLPLQINKPNDSNHRMKIQNTTDALVAPLVGGNRGLLDDALVVCNDSNNGPVVRAAKQFVLDVVFKFTPNSQRIRLNIINVDQLTAVTDYLGA